MGPVTVNSIHVNNSVVDSINTGNVKSIEVSMTQISNRGERELADAFKRFTEAVVNTTEVPQDKKNELLEQVAFLAAEAAVSKKERKPSIIKSVLAGIRDGVAIFAALRQLWTEFQPLLERLI